MGALGSRIPRCRESEIDDRHHPEPQAGPSDVSGSRKRKHSAGPSLGQESENSSSSLDHEENPQLISASHSKKVKITSEHAYQTLFLNGETSDIKIRALGKVWCLHKMFLYQSGYFSTMFRGSWEKSQEDIIDLQINDPNIDADSLHFALGSLYRDKYVLREPLQVQVLATACLLQIDDLIQHCNETMKKTINAKTVCSYYAAAETYGFESAKTGCFQWLLHNLMTHPTVELYKELNVELMSLIICSSNLFVMRKEMDVYTTLKKWMFLRLNPAWQGSTEQILINAQNWFSWCRAHVSDIAFLNTEQGIAFQPVFKNLRFQHMVCDLASTRVIEEDNIIPLEWLSYVYKQHWITLLRAQQYRKLGPQKINRRELEEYSMRCGKRIDKNGKYAWKWSGYNFGLPLHIIFTSQYILFKQRTYKYSCDDSQSLRNIAFRLTLACFDSNGNVSLSKTTGYKILTFGKNKELVVMTLDDIALNFPLYIFCNFLFVSLENPGN